MTLAAAGLVPAGHQYASATLQDALNFQGGSGIEGATRSLLRQAVAALLNADRLGDRYPLTESEVREAVQDAIASGNRDTILELKDLLTSGAP